MELQKFLYRNSVKNLLPETPYLILLSILAIKLGKHFLGQLNGRRNKVILASLEQNPRDSIIHISSLVDRVEYPQGLPAQSGAALAEQEDDIVLAAQFAGQEVGVGGGALSVGVRDQGQVVLYAQAGLREELPDPVVLRLVAGLGVQHVHHVKVGVVQVRQLFHQLYVVGG